MKRTVEGYREKMHGNLRENVYRKECSTIDETRHAVEDAFDLGADIVIITRPGKVERAR